MKDEESMVNEEELGQPNDQISNLTCAQRMFQYFVTGMVVAFIVLGFARVVLHVLYRMP